MAQSRASELKLLAEEESLAKLKRLLLVATFGVRSSTLDEAGNMHVLCRTEDYEPQEWSKYQQRGWALIMRMSCVPPRLIWATCFLAFPRMSGEKKCSGSTWP